MYGSKLFHCIGTVKLKYYLFRNLNWSMHTAKTATGWSCTVMRLHVSWHFKQRKLRYLFHLNVPSVSLLFLLDLIPWQRSCNNDFLINVNTTRPSGSQFDATTESTPLFGAGFSLADTLNIIHLPSETNQHLGLFHLGVLDIDPKKI